MEIETLKNVTTYVLLPDLYFRLSSLNNNAIVNLG